MLADVPAGESPIAGSGSVATVVIADDEKGDRLTGSSRVKVPVGWADCAVRSVRGASSSTGHSELHLLSSELREVQQWIGVSPSRPWLFGL